MNDLTAPSSAGFTLIREFGVTRDLVWAAWTEPARLASWFGPRGLSAPQDRVSLDLRPGGVWRITMVADADGREYPQTFTFIEVEEPGRLVFRADPEGINASAVITLTLDPVAGGTRMTFTVDGLLGRGGLAGLEDGWGSSFDCLADALHEVAA